jgi:hypothetical protein
MMNFSMLLLVVALLAGIRNSDCRSEPIDSEDFTTYGSGYESTDRVDDSNGLLMASLGINYKHIGSLTASTDKLYITIAVKIPEMTLMDLPTIPRLCQGQPVRFSRREQSLGELARRNERIRRASANPLETDTQSPRTIVDICGKYKYLFKDTVIDKLYKKYRYTVSNFHWTAQNLRADIESNVNETLATLTGKYGRELQVRSKRALPILIPIILGLVKGGIAIGGAVAAAVRHNKMQKSMRAILERDSVLKKHHLDFVERTISFNELVVQKVNNLELQINETQEGLKNISRQFNIELAKIAVHQRETNEEIIRYLLMLTQISTSHNSYLRNYLTHVQRLKSYTENFQRGAMKLAEGKLPQEIIKVENFR